MQCPFLVPNLCGCVQEIRDPVQSPFLSSPSASFPWVALWFSPQRPSLLSDPHPRGLIPLCAAELDPISSWGPPHTSLPKWSSAGEADSPRPVLFPALSHPGMKPSDGFHHFTPCLLTSEDSPLLVVL